MYWVRWSDAVIEAGFEPNEMQAAYDDEGLIRQLAELTRDLGHVPTEAEIRMRRHQERDFPSHGTFQRLGSRATRIALMVEFCQTDPKYADVLAIVGPVAVTGDRSRADQQANSRANDDAYVSLLQSGKHYKIGQTNHLGRRANEIDLQLPERAELVHSIRTDDPIGIEQYWHQRFADRRTDGEWFILTREDVAAFRRRRFM